MTQNKQQAVILSPVGRMVQGHPFEFSDTNFENKPLVDSEGKPRVQYFIALAIRKDDPAVNQYYADIQQMGQAAWPTGEARPVEQGGRTDFAWKFEDGDAANVKMGSNLANKDKEGFAGCWIFKFQGGFAPKVYDIDPSKMITDPKAIKRGDYIRVYASINGNGSKTNPGIFMNPSLVQLCAYGEEITTGPDGTAVFGAAPATRLPPGASMTPTAPKAGPATPGGPANNAPPPALPGPAAPAPASPGAPAMPAVTVPVRAMTAKAGAFTYEQYTAQGWTDAALIKEGYMTLQTQSPGTGVTPAPSILRPGQ